MTDPLTDADLRTAVAEMLEALQDIVEACDRMGVSGGNIPHARALIAKYESKTGEVWNHTCAPEAKTDG